MGEAAVGEHFVDKGQHRVAKEAFAPYFFSFFILDFVPGVPERKE